ncbi:MAG TPA: Na+/H+ antiporter NhaA [Ardenticatenaceae bacterium]|nr:Na+/H+ antiporter NhaA [Ardenticatenaceae bacterium]
MARETLQPASHWSETPLAPLLRPIQEFMHESAAGGLVLMGATVVALLLANSPLAELYDRVLHTYMAFSLGPFELRETLLHWINDGLMAIFFLLVGLEIKREVTVGELSDRTAAMLPIAAALGGVLVPALAYVAFNAGGPGVNGWAIPMATDIAFALGCLALLGPRIPFTLKIFLPAVAVVDDLIAVLVIALFYSGGINTAALGVGFGLLLLLFLANILGVRNLPVYLGLGLIVWVAFLLSGIHAPFAGVLLAFTVPARSRIDAPTFVERVHTLLGQFEPTEQPATPMLTLERQQTAVIELEETCEHVQAPLQKLEHALHVPVNFAIIPIFALANAGVPLSLEGVSGDSSSVVLGIVLGLVLGKPLGILTASWLVTRLTPTTLPDGVSWSQMVGAGFLAGIGFTMSLFIASLGFGEGSPLLDTAKIAILIASLLAGCTGFVLLRRAKPTSKGDSHV